MASVTARVAVAVPGNGHRVPVRRAQQTCGRRLVIARGGVRFGQSHSKIARQSVVQFAKRDKAYGYAYGFGYGWGYGHEYGDADWGHVTGVFTYPPEDFGKPVATAFAVAAKTVVEAAAVAFSEPVVAKGEYESLPPTSTEPVVAKQETPKMEQPKRVPTENTPQSPPARNVNLPKVSGEQSEANKLWKEKLPKTKTVSAKEAANKLNAGDRGDAQKPQARSSGSFTYQSGADGRLQPKPRFSETIRMTSPSRPSRSNGNLEATKTNEPTVSPFIQTINALTNLFPLWVLLGALVGMTSPASVTWFKGDMITNALALTMLGMGLTLEFDDFLASLKKPKQIALGVLLQYTIMPILGLLIGRVFPVHPSVAVGLILVGCCPGGTASNVVTYLGKANVALSVVLTTASTFLASFATPLLTKTLAGTLVPVDAIGLAKSTASVVLLPVIVGLVLKKTVPGLVKIVVPFCPLVAVATVALICASIIGKSSVAILEAGPALLLAVVTLHTLGFAFGYFCSKKMGFVEKDRRTVAIEVGMQNSALGVVLATAHFVDPLVAVPCAISATVHSCVGSLLAGAWRLRDAKRTR